MQSNHPVCPCCGSEVSPLDLIIDEGSGFIAYGGGTARLTRKELAVVRALADAYPRALSKEQILDAISDPSDPSGGPSTKIIDVWVCKIRPRLDPLGLIISTQWGIGYVFQLDETGKAAVSREKAFRGTRARSAVDTGDLAMVAMFRAQGCPVTDIARRAGLTFKATIAAIDMIEAAEASKRHHAAIGFAA